MGSLVWVNIVVIVAAVTFTAAYIIYSSRARNICTCGRGANAIPVEVEDRNPAHYPYELVFYIGGMRCNKCPVLVENALNSIDGVWAEVSLTEEKAHVRMKRPVKKTVFNKAVKDAGFRILKMTTEQ